jgi:Fe(3+) dicitrate transport protein
MLIDQLAVVCVSLLQPLLDPGSRTFWPFLIGAVVVVVASGSGRTFFHASSRVDLGLLMVRQLLAVWWVVPEAAGAWAVATGLSRWLDSLVGIPFLASPYPWVLTLVYSGVLFLAWDLSRYVVHRLLHEVPALWSIHQVHHSAEVLTPLTFHRVHPVESVLFGLRGVLVTGVVAGLAFWLFRGAATPFMLFGVYGLGLVLNAATGNLRHSHVWLGFGPTLEKWLISPAQHQLHHSAVASQQMANYGTWLAIWDRWGGSLEISERQPSRFGLEQPNHDPHDVLSALVSPVLDAVRGGRAHVVAAALLVMPGAWAQDEEEAAYEVIVYGEDGVPRVAGSAQRIDEEQLQRFAHDNIHDVLAEVPGVYVRGEDGFGLRPNIGIRGGNADRSARIALMEDGLPLAPAPYAAPAAYYFPMVSRLSGVEVFKGPAAIQHGPQTIGGAVNLLTRSIPDGVDGAADLAYGLRSTFRGHGWGGVGGERAGLLIEGAHLSTNGFKTLDTGGPTSVERQDLMLKGRIEDFDLKLGWGREHSYETYLGLAGEDFETDPYRRYAASDGDEMSWQRSQAELGWHGTISEAAKAEIVVYHRYLDRSWFKLNGFNGGPDLHGLLQQPAGGQAGVFLDILRGEEDAVSAEQLLLRGTNHRRFHSYGMQSALKHKVWWAKGQNHLELGLRLHGDRVTRVHTESPWRMTDGVMERTQEVDTVTMDRVTAADALAFYAHDRLQLGRLEIDPGFRMEWVSTSVDHGQQTAMLVPLPGLAALVTPLDHLDVFAGVHRGFSPVPPGSADGTPPESAWSVESGIRATPGQLKLDVVGFYSDYGSLTGQCTLSSGCSEEQLDTQFDGGRARIVGLESAIAEQVPLPGRMKLLVNGSYTLTSTAFLTSFVSGFPQFGAVEVGDSLPYVPTHKASAQGAVEHKRFGAALAVEGRSGLRDEASQGDVEAIARIPGVVTVNASGRVTLTRHLDGYLTATNLSNTAAVESWRPFGARPVAPRLLMVGLRGRVD